MTDQDHPLTPAEEALLDYSLGRAGQVPAPDGLEAERLRELVETARLAASTTQPAPAPELVAELQAAARAAASPEALGFWRLLEGGLRTNVWVRLVAASLVIHLAALPVLAWLHFSQPERPALWIHFEEPPPVLTSEPQPELLEAVEQPELADPTDLDGQDDVTETED
jgi:hypothetical protein